MDESKQRIIQEYVPGKQVTIAHIIPNPNASLYRKLGMVGDAYGALGILTITPSEVAIISADTAVKAAQVEIVFVDRFSGSLVLSGSTSAVEASVRAVVDMLENTLGFTPCKVTRS